MSKADAGLLEPLGSGHCEQIETKGLQFLPQNTACPRVWSPRNAASSVLTPLGLGSCNYASLGLNWRQRTRETEEKCPHQSGCKRRLLLGLVLRDSPGLLGRPEGAGGVCAHVCMCVGGWFSAAPGGGRLDSPSQSHRPDGGGHSC